MASKSRLGRGLGALFPSLPGEQPARPVTPAAKPQPKPQPKPAAKKPTEGKPAAKKPAQQQPAAGDQSSAPISPLSSTIPSMGAMTRHGDTVSKLAAPMTLQPEAAEHRPIAQNDVDTSSSAQSTKTDRKSVV